MNKKLFFGIFAAATMLFATSCSNDEMDGLKGNESVVSFTLEQPGIVTRAYSDGLKATNLTYAVYETESGAKVDDGVINGAFSGKQASVTFTLEKNKTYDFIFWADAYGGVESPYEFNATNKTLKVSYENVASNDENRDAFYAVRKGLTIPEGSVTETITLYRPFAQLNIGAIGNDVIGFSPAKSSVTVTNVGNVLNFVDGTVTGVTDVPVAFGVAEFPQNEDFPVTGVDNYYSMNYLLAGIDSEVTEVGFTLYNADESASNSRTFANIPIRRNYRTNIYGKIGNILSNSATFNVVIDEQYEKPDYNQPRWEDYAEDFTDDQLAQSVIEISTPEQLAGIAKAVNSGKQLCTHDKHGNFHNQTIKLMADIDLGGLQWTPIGTGTPWQNHFRGTFDGNGHTIRNLTINQIDAANGGLFGQTMIRDTKILNLTLENVNIDVNGNAGAIIAYGGSVVINNCHVKGGNITSRDNTGGIVGLHGANQLGDVIGCSVTDLNITGYCRVGGLIGAVNEGGDYTIKDNTLTNVKIFADLTGKTAEDYAGVGEVVGSYVLVSGGVEENNTTTNVTIEQK